ncbi:hypothetical protein Avbf_16868 [Armadillidium vulgare]|nr:hypothetical protein Avbf_16868 [Armadillidium vulgare]
MSTACKAKVSTIPKMMHKELSLISENEHSVQSKGKHIPKMMQELSLNSENEAPLIEKDKPSFIATIEQTRDIPAGSRNLFEVTLSDMGKKSPREERGKYVAGYRMFKGMIFIKQGVNYKVYMPESLIETAIMLAHAAYESGHTGVERTLKRLKRRDNQKDWDQFLPLAQTTINNTYNASIKSDPHFLLYGYTKRMPSELPNSSLIKDKRAENTITKADSITETLYKRIKRIREQGKDILEKEVRKYTLQQDKHSKTREVRPGDMVYMKAVKPPKLSPKLYRKWRGPFRIEGLANRFGSGNVYILRDPQNNKMYNCHADNFKIVRMQRNHGEQGETLEEEIVDMETPDIPEPREPIEGAGAEQPANLTPVAEDEPSADEESPVSVRTKVRDPDKEYKPPPQGYTKILRSPIKTRMKRRILGYHNFDVDRYVFNIIDNPRIVPIKYPLTSQNNSDRTLLLHDVANQLVDIGLPKCLASVVIIWVNIIFQNTLRFLVNKQNKSYRTLGDTLLQLMNVRCYDEKGSVKMSVITQRMILYTADPDTRSQYMEWFTPFVTHESWMEGICEYVRIGNVVKLYAICEYLFHKKAWMSMTEIYIALMDRVGRMEMSFQMEPSETFDPVYRFLIINLSLGCKRLAYRHAKHQDKLGLVKILLIGRNRSLLLSESRFLFPQLQTTYSIVKHIIKRMELEEKYPIDFPQLLKWFCGKMRFFYNKEENVVDRRFVLFKLFKLYVGQGCQDMEVRETIEMFMMGTSVMDIRELYAKVCIRSWENRLFKIAVLITEMVSPTNQGHQLQIALRPTGVPSQVNAVVSGVGSQKAVRLDRYRFQGNNRKTDGWSEYLE